MTSIQPPAEQRQIGKAAVQQPQSRGDRQRSIALVVLCAGFLMIILDQTIVNVALPSIQSDLHFSQSSLAWVVNAYLIAFGGLLLLVGRLGDLIGRRRIFLIGLTVFTSASLLCGLAQSQTLLIGARFVQGIGGAMTSAVILGMIVTMFPKPSEQAKAISVYSFVASAGASIGLLAGGVLTQGINWHWIFFVSFPIGIATAFFALRLLPADKGIGLEHGADGSGGAAARERVDARRVHDRRSQPLCVGLSSHARFRRPRGRATGLVRRAPGASRQPARPATRVSLPNSHRREPCPGADGRRPVRDVLPRRALPTARAALRRDRGRPRVPAGGARDRRAVAGLLSASDHALRRQGDLLPGLVLVAVGLVLFRGAPVDAHYLRDLLPAMLLIGIGAGSSSYNRKLWMPLRTKAAYLPG